MSPVRKLGILVLLASAGVALYFRQELSMDTLGQTLEAMGWAGPLGFVLLYALATVAFFPGAVLTLLGGALFGLGWGTFLNLTGATLGAGFAFLASRWLWADSLEAGLGPRLQRIKQGVEQEDWRFVAMVRLVPLFPFNLLNYALGLTRIGWGRYLLTTYVTMLPGALVYTYLGVLGQQAASEGRHWADWGPRGLLALGLLALVVYLPKLYFERTGRLAQRS